MLLKTRNEKQRGRLDVKLAIAIAMKYKIQSMSDKYMYFLYYITFEIRL